MLIQYIVVVTLIHAGSAQAFPDTGVCACVCVCVCVS